LGLLGYKLDKREFSKLRFLDLSENPIDTTAALSLGGWLKIDSLPYVKVTGTNLNADTMESLYCEMRSVWTKNQVAEFMKRIIFIKSKDLQDLKVAETDTYKRLLQQGILPEDYIIIHEQFYNKYFRKNNNTTKERKTTAK
jgi:hypothetical protein